jgi:signal transduction histidine kinase/CheY-like chemotaxis protein
MPGRPPLDRDQELAEAQRALQRERSLFSRGPVTVFRWRAEAGWPVEYVSPNIAHYGYAPEDLTSGRISFASIVHPDDLARVADEVAAHTRAGVASFVQSYRVRTAAGQLREIDDYTMVVRDEVGVVTHYDGYVLDVTERKRLEADLLQAAKMESIGRLAGGVAHDFNNLLTIVLMQLELASHLAGDRPELTSVLDEVRDAASRAAQLTRQLLAVARRQVVTPSVFDLDQALERLRPLLARLLGPAIELLVVTRAGGRVRLDPAQLEQVLLNLVVNARDAIDGAGRVSIETSRVAAPDAPTGEWLRLRVTDTGAGLDEASRAHLFEPFYTTKPVGRGTGLGLATCYGIVRQAGGHISARQATERGTTFEVLLPPVDAPAAVAAPPPANPTPPRPLRLMVVDDEASVRRLAAGALRHAGHAVLEAAGAEEALALAAEAGPVDLLITDLVMSGISGGALAERLRALRPGLLVLFMSGYVPGLPAQAPDAPAAFLEKPFDAATLLQAVASLTAGRDAEKREPGAPAPARQEPRE